MIHLVAITEDDLAGSREFAEVVMDVEQDNLVAPLERSTDLVHIHGLVSYFQIRYAQDDHLPLTKR